MKYDLPEYGIPMDNQEALRLLDRWVNAHGERRAFDNLEHLVTGRKNLDSTGLFQSERTAGEVRFVEDECFRREVVEFYQNTVRREIFRQVLGSFDAILSTIPYDHVRKINANYLLFSFFGRRDTLYRRLRELFSGTGSAYGGFIEELHEFVERFRPEFSEEVRPFREEIEKKSGIFGRWRVRMNHDVTLWIYRNLRRRDEKLAEFSE